MEQGISAAFKAVYQLAGFHDVEIQMINGCRFERIRMTLRIRIAAQRQIDGSAIVLVE